MLENMRMLSLVAVLTLAGCSSAPEPKGPKQLPLEPPGPAASLSKHPLAKYLEFGGFRLKETSAGRLQVKFIAVNHSEADLGDLVTKVRITTSADKPGDPPVTEFEAKIPALGPQEIRDVTATAATKLRVYEIPDWQFLRAQFEITFPAP